MSSKNRSLRLAAISLALAGAALASRPEAARAADAASLKPSPRISSSSSSEIASAQGLSDWGQFRLRVDETAQRERYEGSAYMVSGGLVLIGSVIGLNNSEDILAKAVYSISQSLSIAAIGYGGFLYAIGDEDRNFFYIIENSNSLSDAQRGEILRSYNARNTANQSNSRRIRMITHGLIAAANFYSASQENDPGLKTAQAFIGGVNAIAAFSIAF